MERGDFKISIKKNDGKTTVLHAHTHQTGHQATEHHYLAPEHMGTEKIEAPASKTDTAAGNFVTIKSPMIGTYYKSQSPDKPAFVQVGDEIKPGQVLCIVEAMKLFNEIESEVSGKVVKILVENASPIEYDQPLFLVEPM